MKSPDQNQGASPDYRFPPENTTKEGRLLGLLRELLKNDNKYRIDWIAAVIGTLQLCREDLGETNEKEVYAIDNLLKGKARTTSDSLAERIRLRVVVTSSDIVAADKVVRVVIRSFNNRQSEKP